MNRIYLIFFISLCMSCVQNKKDDPIARLRTSSGLDLPIENVKVIEYSLRNAGIKEESILQAIYDIKDVNHELIEKQLINLGYDKLPIRDFNVGNGFNNNFNPSDSGYFKLKLLHRSIIKLLVIINFTQRKIIIYQTEY